MRTQINTVILKLLLCGCNLLNLTSCKDNTDYNTTSIDSSPSINDSLSFIVSIDYHLDSSIQRFFVSSDTSRYIVDSIIKAITKLDIGDSNTNISFFTERKYARYSDEFELELDSNGMVTKSSLRFIEKVKNEYYFGEYYFKDSVFIQCPGRNR